LDINWLSYMISLFSAHKFQPAHKYFSNQLCTVLGLLGRGTGKMCIYRLTEQEEPFVEMYLSNG
jgi:hypothetical protein